MGLALKETFQDVCDPVRWPKSNGVTNGTNNTVSEPNIIFQAKWYGFWSISSYFSEYTCFFLLQQYTNQNRLIRFIWYWLPPAKDFISKKPQITGSHEYRSCWLSAVPPIKTSAKNNCINRKKSSFRSRLCRKKSRSWAFPLLKWGSCPMDNHSKR